MKKTSHTSGVSEANAVRHKWKAMTQKKEKFYKKLILWSFISILHDSLEAFSINGSMATLYLYKDATQR